MNRYLRIVIILLLVMLLMGIRFFQNQLFYDPFLAYFEGDFQSKALPEYEALPLMANVIIRYVLNSAISIGIIFLIFPKSKNLKISLVLYLLFGLIFLIAYGIMIFNQFPMGYLPVFYVRRFLIQPLLLLILIPSFYYLEHRKTIEPKEK